MGAGETELEIKLIGAPRDVAALARSPILREFAVAPASVERLSTTYYDTPYRTLAEKGISLRLREESGGYVQTIKIARPGEGSLSRLEDERVLESAALFPVLPDDPVFADVAALAGAALPVARTVSDRWSFDLCKGRSRIEAAIDLGRIEALSGGKTLRQAPLAEFELELIEGKPQSLFRIARRIVAAAGGRLQVGVLSKAEQAARLAEEPDLAAEPPLDFPADATAADLLGLALRRSAARIAELQPLVADRRLPEAAHQMRVALRRFRAIERLFRKAARADDIKAASRQARAFARAIGEARDWDVFHHGALARARAAAGERDGFQRLVARAEALRARAWSEGAQAFATADFARFCLDLLELGHAEPWRETGSKRLFLPARDFAAAALNRRFAEALAAGEAVRADEPATRHPLRIALKKLRYSAQLFRPLYPQGGRKRYLGALAALQEGLGAVNDAVVAARLADRAAEGAGPGAARAAGILSGIETVAAGEAVRRADEQWARFAALRPFWRTAELVSADGDAPLSRVAP